MKRRRGWCGEIASQDLSSGRENPDKPWFKLGRAREWDVGNCHEVKCQIIREYRIQLDLHLVSSTVHRDRPLAAEPSTRAIAARGVEDGEFK